jgi:NADPH:quinone reductase-like Zn-dependent oxidoreductase
VFPLGDAADAHRALEARASRGKLLLAVHYGA